MISMLQSAHAHDKILDHQQLAAFLHINFYGKDLSIPFQYSVLHTISLLRLHAAMFYRLLALSACV